MPSQQEESNRRGTPVIDRVREPRQKRALVCAQAFPPLLKNAGGVAKRYLALCRALIDGLNWQVALLTVVDITKCKDPDVHRWLREGSLVWLPARGVVLDCDDGRCVFLDVTSIMTTISMFKEMFLSHRSPCGKGPRDPQNKYDLVIADDIPWRCFVLMLARAAGIPSIVTTHTDATRVRSYLNNPMVRVAWYVHILTTRLAASHATVSRVFADLLLRNYGSWGQTNAIWPPILWCQEFRKDPQQDRDAADALRAEWEAKLGFKPRCLFLSAGRWAAEKRILLIVDAIPEDCALVIIGDGTCAYAEQVARCGIGRRNVLPLRGMLGGADLRLSYMACDIFASASDFETLGNTVVESITTGTPVAVQPAQGHLEFVQDGVNSFFVDYDDTAGARAKLRAIVDSGAANPQRVQDILPELEPLGRRFRTSDFPADVEQQLLQPALDVGAARNARPVRERCVRTAMFAIWIPIWIIARIVLRILWIITPNPRFTWIGKFGNPTYGLGSCTETPKPKSPPGMGRNKNNVTQFPATVISGKCIGGVANVVAAEHAKAE